MNRRFVRTVPLLVFVSVPALASEKTIAKSKVPAAVMQTVESTYPKSKVVESVIETEGKRKLYEMRLQAGEARVDLKIEPGGKLVAQEHVMDPKTAPAPVTNAALAPPYQDWKVKRVEKVDNLEVPDKSGYEVEIEKGGRHREALFTAQGTLLGVEDQEEEEGDTK